jgi:prepilin-type N-terminal cleavage/methylation domain-containing protein
MSQTVRNPNSAKGFSFIELLIAMAILSMGMLAAVSMHFGSTRNNTKGNIYTQANMLAKAQLENLKNQDVGLLVAGGPYPDPNNPINPNGEAGGIYTRSWTIDNLGTGARRISVTVQWNRRGSPGSVVVSSNTKGGGV